MAWPKYILAESRRGWYDLIQIVLLFLLGDVSRVSILVQSSRVEGARSAQRRRPRRESAVIPSHGFERLYVINTIITRS